MYAAQEVPLGTYGLLGRCGSMEGLAHKPAIKVFSNTDLH